MIMSGTDFEVLPLLIPMAHRHNQLLDGGIKMQIKTCSKGHTHSDRQCKICAKVAMAAWRVANKDHETAYNVANKERRKITSASHYAKNVAKIVAYRAANAEKTKIYNAAYNATNRDILKIQSAVYRAANAEKRKAVGAAYRAANPDSMRTYRLKNADQIKAYSVAYYAKNTDKNRTRCAAWLQANPDKSNAKSARYRASKLQATPAWANNAKIEEFYYTARMLGMHTGDHYHVDHIVPLKSKVVCGLHCEANLQVLLGVDNLRKRNRHVI